MKITPFAGRQFEDTDDGLAMRLEPADRTPLGALRLLLEGVEMLRDVGCIDHVDSADEEHGGGVVGGVGECQGGRQGHPGGGRVMGILIRTDHPLIRAWKVEHERWKSMFVRLDARLMAGDRSVSLDQHMYVKNRMMNAAEWLHDARRGRPIRLPEEYL